MTVCWISRLVLTIIFWNDTHCHLINGLRIWHKIKALSCSGMSQTVWYPVNIHSKLQKYVLWSEIKNNVLLKRVKMQCCFVSLWMNYFVTIQMAATEQYFPTVLFPMVSNVESWRDLKTEVNSTLEPGIDKTR